MAQTGRRNTKKKAAKRNALGRGLSALMTSNAQLAEVEEVPVSPDQGWREEETTKEKSAPKLSIAKEDSDSENDKEYAYLELNEIVPQAGQPRREFSENELSELADSIKQSGLLQPILVRPKPEGPFEIVAGERRFRAAKKAGLKQVPVRIVELDDKEAFQIAIIENVQREDLNPLEEALAYQRLADEFEDTVQSIAEKVGKNRATVTNTLRLLQLAEPIQSLLKDGKLSEGHGRALLMAPETIRLKLAQRVISEGLSVRATERLATGGPAAGQAPIKSRKHQRLNQIKTPAVIDIENRLRRKFGTKVGLEFATKDKGELKISFFSEDELQSLLDKLGV